MRLHAHAFLFAGLLLVTLPSLAFAAGVYIATWETHYDVGETVWFTVRNDLNEPIHIPSYPFWGIIEEATGHRGAGCSGLPTVHTIQPGQSEDHSWSQVMCSTGAPANPGVYWLEVVYYIDSAWGEARLAHVPFCIGEGCILPTGVEDGIELSTWGRVKSEYR